MFKKIIHHKGFWRSVVSLAIAFALLFCIFKWVIEGFSFAFISQNNPYLFLLSIALGGFIYGFFVTYGKFWRKLKEQQQ
ncbi:MAG: hypothetical protein R2781_07205 [Flavobacteriaceae bacterium]